MLIEDVKRKQPKVYRQWQDQPEIMCPPEGETLSHAQQRVQSALSKLLKKQKEGAVGLVVPEPLATLVASYLSHTELGDLWKGGSACGSWEVIAVEPATLVASGP
jgi:broad specificity phosphatase PhoE